MTQNPNSPQHTPDAPQWIAGNQPPPEQQAAAQPLEGQQPSAGQQAAAQPTVVQQPIAGQPAGQGVAAATGKGRWRSSDGKPTGLVLAGAGSLLAVLAFLGGTAVGHAWGGSAGTGQTQFGGPGGGQFPGQGGQFPGQGGTGQGGTGTQDSGLPTQTQPNNQTRTT